MGRRGARHQGLNAVGERGPALRPSSRAEVKIYEVMGEERNRKTSASDRVAKPWGQSLSDTAPMHEGCTRTVVTDRRPGVQLILFMALISRNGRACAVLRTAAKEIAFGRVRRFLIRISEGGAI